MLMGREMNLKYPAKVRRCYLTGSHFAAGYLRLPYVGFISSIYIDDTQLSSDAAAAIISH